jgi:hypothetical protein
MQGKAQNGASRKSLKKARKVRRIRWIIKVSLTLSTVWGLEKWPQRRRRMVLTTT